MTLKNKINIIGSGGHSRPVIEIADELFPSDDKEIFDINYDISRKNEKILGYKVAGSLNSFFKKKEIKEAFIAIGDNKKRRDIYKKLLKKKIIIPNLISKNSNISKHIKIGKGNFINKLVYIGAESVIGNNNIINTGAVLEHQTKIGSNSHIGPKAVVGGHVKIGNNVFLGLGSKVINKVKICSNCTIGAGSVVIKSISKPGIYVGIPAKKIKKIKK
tara:strand:+ start:259 stop:909 length:651 start_codon:yes stop_codon:yes gene_type:complete